MQARYDDAEGLYQQALPYRQIGDRLGEAGCLSGMGQLARARNANPELAIPLFIEAARAFTAAGNLEWARRASRAAADATSSSPAQRAEG